MAPSCLSGTTVLPRQRPRGARAVRACGPRAGPLRLFQRALHGLAAVVVAFAADVHLVAVALVTFVAVLDGAVDGVMRVVVAQIAGQLRRLPRASVAGKAGLAVHVVGGRKGRLALFGARKRGHLGSKVARAGLRTQVPQCGTGRPAARAAVVRVRLMLGIGGGKVSLAPLFAGPCRSRKASSPPPRRPPGPCTPCPRSAFSRVKSSSSPTPPSASVLARHVPEVTQRPIEGPKMWRG